MIYLKKDNETQTAFIPKNGEYEGKKTYKEGYDEGYNEGLYVGKLTPYTTKGVFDKNGYYDRVWAIDWSRNVEMPISWLDNDNIIEVSFFALENSALISTSGAFIDIFLQDEKMIVNYKNFMLEIPCKYQMWHTLKLQDKYVYLDGERYEYPNFDEYFNGTAFFGKSRRNGMFCRSFVSYIYVTEDNGVEMYYYYGREDGKVKRLRNENGNWIFQTMEFGVWNYATNTPPMDDVLVRVEGGNCPELTELNVSQNGRYEGAYNVVNVDVPDVNGSYDEGYNNGYNDGKAEGGGSCNIEETRWVNPTPADVDGSGYLVYHPTDGYDGMQRIALQMNDYNSIKYNEGYEAGKAEGGDCPELTELNVTENGTYEGAYNKVNVDVPTEGGSCNLQDKWVGYNSPDELTDGAYVDVYPDEGYDGMGRVVADVRGLMQYKYDEGYNFAINNDAVLIPARIEKVYNTIALRTENLFDSDIIKDRTLLVGSGDEYTENGFISYTQNKNGIVISGSDEVGAKYVTKIRKDALNWNTIEYFYSYTIVNFGVDMTRDMSSNVRHLYIKYNGGVGTGVDSDIYFRTGCFATSNLLNKIVFYEPYYINVEDKAFEGVSSRGKVIVVGEDNAENRAKYDTLMAQLGSEWTLTFVDEYNE